MIALPTKTFEVTDDRGTEHYTLTLLDGVESAEIAFAIIGAIGASFAKMGAVSGKRTPQELAIVLTGTALSSLDRELTTRCREAFANSCKVRKGSTDLRLDEGQFRLHFAGRPAHMMQWFLKCAEFNFSDFLAESYWKALLAKVPWVKVGSESTSPATSTESGST